MTLTTCTKSVFIGNDSNEMMTKWFVSGLGLRAKGCSVQSSAKLISRRQVKVNSPFSVPRIPFIIRVMYKYLWRKLTAGLTKFINNQMYNKINKQREFNLPHTISWGRLTGILLVVVAAINVVFLLVVVVLFIDDNTRILDWEEFK